MSDILIAVDLSDSNRPAFDAGIALAKDLDADVVVVHAFEELGKGVGIAGGAVQRDIAESKAETDEDEAIELTEEWLEDARAEGLDVDVVAQAADPAELILQTARERDVHTIVVGTHGRSGLLRGLVGSVAESVVRKADRPVLVVPARMAD